MNDGQLRALLDQALDPGPMLPRLEAVDRLLVEFHALVVRIARDQTGDPREAAAHSPRAQPLGVLTRDGRGGGEAIEQPRA